MCESSDRVHTLTLSQEEFNTLQYILGKGLEKMRTGKTWKGGILGEVPVENSDIKNVKAIHTRLEVMEAWEESGQPPIDMATVNAAFDRIREALAEVDSAINPTKTICLLDEV